jgi:thiamine biosynthesis lipoprotein
MRAAWIVLVATVISVGTAQAAVTHRARFLMGTVCEVTLASADADEIDQAFAEAERVEAMLSTWREESELSRVNRGAAQPSAELRMLLDTALDWSRRTNGTFNPRVKSLIDVWQSRGEGTLPATSAIAAALQSAQIEEGAFGKGYAIDRMLARISTRGAMINFGGQIAARGTLRVTIADPTDRQRAILGFTLRDASLSTSSGSEKTFVVAGHTYSHLLDPRSGQALPPRGSASAIADQALVADILSTALYVMGEDEGLRWADANGVAAIFITPTRHIRLSAKARERARGLELLDRNFSVKD